LAQEALAAAQIEGITPKQVEEETGPLADWIARSLAHLPTSEAEDVVTAADD